MHKCARLPSRFERSNLDQSDGTVISLSACIYLRHEPGKNGTAAVCVTVPHRALTAPRRVASLKSRLAPTCSTGSDADWSTPPATPAIGTPIDQAFGKFPPIYRPSERAQPPRANGPRGLVRGEESGIRWSFEEGRHFRHMTRTRPLLGVPRRIFRLPGFWRGITVGASIYPLVAERLGKTAHSPSSVGGCHGERERENSCH